ncbi:hypothetical protein A8F94_03560 [Bacillus sp. FJAT-27225]|uniref:hypothetical protein n=1 Tax=Bacillus sp. FJAT-27225 TaxID=1743144 RepID=UPI00080C25B2|nr:hypothetical protein [Bacillus sp. FJAT-27225]OCA90959.1 hypothetical protein A8F94_03560 [Bacillus sp. FJAT-27225]
MHIFILMITMLICGYLFSSWMVISNPFSLNSFLLDLVLNPLSFFAAAVAYFSGVGINGYLIRTFSAAPKRKALNRLSAFFICFGSISIFYFLYQVSPVHTLVFFGSSLIYGMISIYF